MFSFHKPKIYRSLCGCCICKAKSSSSRFTDSKKYEAEFEKCFRIIEKRSGEICNACVLLVKRWKKLPPGTQRDWRHVVDARAGPGTKSLKAAKLINGNSTTSSPSLSSSLSSPSNTSSTSSSLPLSHNKKHNKPKKVNSSVFSRASVGLNVIDDNLSECSIPLGRIPSLERSDSSDIEDDLDEDEDYLSDDYDKDGNRKRKLRGARSSSKSTKSMSKNIINGSSNLDKNTSKRNKFFKSNNPSKVSSFLDMSFWRKEKICCGIIFKGPDNEVLIYPKLLKPCSCRKNSTLGKPVGITLSDNSSVTSSTIEDDANSNASSYNSVI